jgi:hypothetical protein
MRSRFIVSVETSKIRSDAMYTTALCEYNSAIYSSRECQDFDIAAHRWQGHHQSHCRWFQLFHSDQDEILSGIEYTPSCGDDKCFGVCCWLS